MIAKQKSILFFETGVVSNWSLRHNEVGLHILAKTCHRPITCSGGQLKTTRLPDWYIQVNDQEWSKSFEKKRLHIFEINHWRLKIYSSDVSVQVITVDSQKWPLAILLSYRQTSILDQNQLWQSGHVYIYGDVSSNIHCMLTTSSRCRQEIETFSSPKSFYLSTNI